MDLLNKDLNFYRINELQAPYIKAESYIAVRKRGMRTIKNIVKHKQDNDSILIVAHGTVINETITGLLRIRELNWYHMLEETHNCFLVVTEYKNKKFSLLAAPTNFFLHPSGKLLYDKTNNDDKSLHKQN